MARSGRSRAKAGANVSVVALILPSDGNCFEQRCTDGGDLAGTPFQSHVSHVASYMLC